MLVDDQDCGQARANVGQAECGLGREARLGRSSLTRTAREDIERIGVDEASVVVADVDDDAVAGAIFGVEIDVKLGERLF